MKKAILAFGLTLMSVSSLVAQEAAIAAPADAAAVATEVTADAAIVDAPVAGETIMEGTVLDGQIIDNGQPMDMTYTAAPVMAAPAAQGCGCNAAAPVYSAAPSIVEVAAPAADCGCAAAPVANCGCNAAPACEPAPCCRQPRERRYVVRSAASSLRARRACCQPAPAPCCN